MHIVEYCQQFLKNSGLDYNVVFFIVDRKYLYSCFNILAQGSCLVIEIEIFRRVGAVTNLPTKRAPRAPNSEQPDDKIFV